MYEAHLEWRQEEGCPDRLAAAFAAIPQHWITLGGAAEDGTRVLLVQGARYDLGVEPREYSLAICHAIEGAFTPEEEGRLTVLVDVRSGADWPNPPAAKLVPFFRDANRVTSDNYPERVERLLVYPVPWAVTVLVNFVTGLLRPAQREKLRCIPGPSHVGAPCPAEDLRTWVSRSSLPEHAAPSHAGL